MPIMPIPGLRATMDPSSFEPRGVPVTAMRRAPVALILALLLAVAAGLLPAVAPAVSLPAAFAPAVAFAADDIEITTATRYAVDPEAGRVRVVVDVTAVNRKPNQVDGGTVKRYFYDGVDLGIQPEARNLRATQDGAATGLDVAKREGYRLVTVRFRANIYLGQTAHVRLAFDLPGGEPRSASDVRVGSAFATFMAWAFGDSGTVRVEVPASFSVTSSGSTLEPAPGKDGLAVYTAATDRPPEWYAWVNATNDDALTRDRLALGGGDEVLIRAWPEDAPWRSHVRTILRDGVPDLVGLIGLDWPVDGALTVTEVHTPLLEGYAGFYDPATDQITISEDLDELTIIHEASHAWFNRSLFTERWITEGLADEYAARVLRELGRDYPNPGAVKRTSDVAFPLEVWPAPAPIRDETADAREQYGYDASWLVMRSIVRAVGLDGMRAVFAAAADGSVAYRGAVPPEHTRLPNDWRRFLDLADELGAGAGTEDLIKKWALDDAAAKLLPARAAARRAYADLVSAGRAWTAPVVVRMALDRWDFNEATATIEQATGVLALRDAIVAAAADEGLTPDGALETGYEAATSRAELAVLGERARESLTVLGDVAAAADAVAAPRDWLEDLGLEGIDPGAGVVAARAAWEDGDLEAARTAAAGAVAQVAAAPEAGRTKALTYAAGGTVVVLTLLLLVVVVAMRRRGSAARRARAAAAGAALWPVPGAGSLTDVTRPYATLPPDGPPAEPPGGPPSGDEGADRS